MNRISSGPHFRGWTGFFDHPGNIFAEAAFKTVDGKQCDRAGARSRASVSHRERQVYDAMEPVSAMMPSSSSIPIPRSSTDASDDERRSDPIASLSDSALIDRLKRGSAEAGQVLVARHCEPLLRYLRRLVGSDHVAEELHQQTWLSVLEHLESFDLSISARSGVGGFKPWLFRIATNKANDLWRSKGRERVVKSGLRLIVETEAPDASHRMARNEQEEQLQRAINQLPESQRQVLLLRYYSGMKFVEIAEMLGCPLNTALGRMHKAMMKLKDAIDPGSVMS